MAAISLSLIGAWTLPLWLSVDILAVAQFPWRLLSIATVPLALFSGALVFVADHSTRSSPSPARALIAVIALALIVLSGRPQLDWMDVFSSATVDLAPPVFAQLDIDKGILDGGVGVTSLQEFRPRWVDPELVLDPSTVTAPPAQPQITLRRAGPLSTEFSVDSSIPLTLPFTQILLSRLAACAWMEN